MSKNKLHDEIGKLADLFEYGALQADTEPAAFLARVRDEIVRLRATTAQPEPAEVCASASALDAWHAARSALLRLSKMHNVNTSSAAGFVSAPQWVVRVLQAFAASKLRPAAEVREEAIADYQRVHEVCGPVHSLRSVEEVRAEARREALEEAAGAVRGRWLLSDMPRDFDTLEDAAKSILALAEKK